MKIKSKKTGEVRDISEARWERIKRVNRGHLYTVVGAEKPKKEPKKVVIEDLSKPKEEEPKVEEKPIKVGRDLGVDSPKKETE